MKIFLIMLIQFITISLYSWPGDQDSLICTNIFDKDPEKVKAIKAAYLLRIKNGEKAAVDEEIKALIRDNHDMDYRVTKLGDSLSDLVDFYGLAIPRNIFPNYGDAAGTFGRIPVFMDSWTDYMTAGAGILDPNAKLNFQNFGVSGFQTMSVMSTLGIDVNGTREDWSVNENATRCVKKRASATGMVPGDYYEAITKEKSSLRSTLMVGGNDVIQSGLGFNGWLPFLNRYQVDSSLMNIMAITDWHLENGKQIFLEGALPVLSHPARNAYDTSLINRQTLCKPLNDLLVDLNEIPWYAAFIPGMMESIIKWNVHVITEVTKFLSDIYNPPPKPNTGSPGGFVNQANEAIDTQLDSLLDGYLEFTANYNPALSDAQKAEIKRQIFERRTSPDKQYNDTPARILFTSASIAQACLNDRIKNNMLPLYKQSYPKNVDGYPMYSHFNRTGDIPNASNFWVPEDIVFRQTGIFFQGSGFWDAIHIGPEGYKRWGILVGSKIAGLGYHTPGDPNSIPIEVSLELNDAWGIIKKTARNVGVIGMEATPRGVTVSPDGKSYGGYYRQYTEGSGIYLKLYTSNTPENTANVKYQSGAIHLPNKVNSTYKSNGGPEGKLGFPMSGTMCWGPGAFCNYKLTLFEKGFIQVDETPLIGGGVSVATAVIDVPTAKINDPPDFDTCVSAACGSRWFEHNKVYLQPTSGKPPFTFQVISGNLPPGFSLTPTGLLFGGPTNTQGSWTFRVMIIDSKKADGQVNSAIKTLTFSTGL